MAAVHTVGCEIAVFRSNSPLHKKRNHFSLESNEIIITGTTGIIAASYYYVTPLECIILFWLWFFPVGRWQIILIIYSHSETSVTSTSCLLEDRQDKHDYKLCLSNHTAVYHSKQYLSYYYITMLIQAASENLCPTTYHADNTCKSTLLSSIQHILKHFCFPHFVSLSPTAKTMNTFLCPYYVKSTEISPQSYRFFLRRCVNFTVPERLTPCFTAQRLIRSCFLWKYFLMQRMFS